MTEQEKDLLLGLAALMKADTVINDDTSLRDFKLRTLRSLLEPFQDDIRKRASDALGRWKADLDRRAKAERDERDEQEGRDVNG